MAQIPGIPTNYTLQTGNGTNFLSWDLVAGATQYLVQRSTDGVAFSTLATVTPNQYLDSAVTLGSMYFYQVAASNGTSTSPYTTAQSCVPTTTGEMSLGALRLASQQRADRVGSTFVTTQEWNFFINQALFELYDLLVDTYEDYFYAPPISFTSNGSDFMYPLPDGVLTFRNQAGSNFVPAPFYKLAGVDLALNTSNNAYVTVNKFNFIDRNRFVYPNTASTQYGVFNLQYRLVGLNQIQFIPTPSAGQVLRLWYIPRMPQLLLDTDTTITGVSGWNQYVIARAAMYALSKEESDITSLQQELIFLKARIESSAMNRDAGQADTISDTRQNDWSSGWGGGRGGAVGGW